jgi:hypothetical protein
LVRVSRRVQPQGLHPRRRVQHCNPAWPGSKHLVHVQRGPTRRLACWHVLGTWSGTPQILRTHPPLPAAHCSPRYSLVAMRSTSRTGADGRTRPDGAGLWAGRMRHAYRDTPQVKRHNGATAGRGRAHWGVTPHSTRHPTGHWQSPHPVARCE